MFVIPVPFSKEHKGMLAHCKELLDYQNGMVAIHPRHNKLITALRTAVENGEGYLDKEITSFDDCFLGAASPALFGGASVRVCPRAFAANAAATNATRHALRNGERTVGMEWMICRPPADRTSYAAFRGRGPLRKP